MKNQFRRSFRNDAGISTVEAAVLFPVVLVVIFTAMQVGFYWHGSNIAVAAAEEGVRAATGRISNSGSQAARNFANSVGNGTLSNVSVDTRTGSRRVHVTVQADTISLVPGLNLTVTKQVSGPIERFTG